MAILSSSFQAARGVRALTRRARSVAGVCAGSYVGLGKGSAWRLEGSVRQCSSSGRDPGKECAGAGFVPGRAEDGHR